MTKELGAIIAGHGEARVEEALRRERDRMRSVLEGMGEAFVLLAHDFTVLDINAEGLKLEARNRDEIVGRNHWDVWPNTKGSVLGRLYERAIANREPVSLEHCYEWEDGRERWIDMRAYPVPDGLAIFYRDITDRKHAEQELVSLNERIRSAAAEQAAILGQLTEGVIVADVEGRITFVNDAAERLHGVKLLGVGPDDYTDAYRLLTEDGEPYPAHQLPLARAVLNNETVLDARWRIARQGGDEVLAIGSATPFRDPAGRPLGAILTLRDDTERHRAEHALTRASKRLDAILNNTRMAVFLMDDRQQCVYANAAAEKLTGYCFAQMQGRPLHDVVHHKKPDGSHYPIDECPIDRAFPDIAQTSGEELFVAPDGSFYPVAFTASPLLDDGGAPVGTVIEARNIAEEKTRDAALRELTERLEQRVAEEVVERLKAEEALRQSQKMEAVGQLTGGIAHDFNNMLAVVVGSLDLLERKLGATDPRLNRHLEAAQNAAKRATALTSRLLAFSRQQTLRPKPLDANKLVSDMTELLRHALGASIKLEIVAAGGLWRVHADQNQLENAMLNLAVNARDAMPNGGRLTVETHNAHLDERYVTAHPGLHAGQYVMIAVTDTGSGMSSDVVAKAFDPFFTTKEIGRGTGLGLSQVYGFVKQSGGHVAIYSEPGEGTTVKVYLPRFTGAAAADEGGAPALAAIKGFSGELVLVVEDEPAVRSFSVDALLELGYSVLEAENGAEALRLLDRHPEVVLLFTDVIMPDQNGRKLAEEARRRRPGLKVLFTTGYSRNAIVHNGVLDPGVQMIGKPFTVAELGQRVREVLDVEAAKPET
jgi:PAS domain S-box-containing protein